MNTKITLTRRFVQNCTDQGIEKEDIPDFIRAMRCNFIPILRLNVESSQVAFNLHSDYIEIIDPFQLTGVSASRHYFGEELLKLLSDIESRKAARHLEKFFKEE